MPIHTICPSIRYAHPTCPYDPITIYPIHDPITTEHEALFEKYEKEGRARKTMPAQELWFAILSSQVETGTPYMLYKDSCNSKSNQQNLGTIKSSNLCTEIIEYTAPDEVAVCNLASVNLAAFVGDDAGECLSLGVSLGLLYGTGV